MKKAKYFFAAILMLCCTCFFGVCFADAPKDFLYDFSETNGSCGWTTNLSDQVLAGDEWTGTTNAINNTIYLVPPAKSIKGSDYPYFVMRVKYEMPEGVVYQPVTHVYIATADENGNEVSGLWSGKVSKGYSMSLGKDGIYVTYFFDFGSNAIYNENYVKEVSVGVGLYYERGIKVSMDFAAFIADKTAAVSFEDAAGNAYSLPKPAEAQIGMPFSLDAYTASKEDNRFLGWSLEPNAKEPLESIECIKGDTTVYAVWEKAETMKITYHTSEDSKSVSFLNPGERLYSPITPTREDGLIFYGWSSSADSSEIIPYNTTVSKAMEVYAVWGEGYEWNFDTDGYLGSTSVDQLTNLSVQGGVLRATTTGIDPKISLQIIAPLGKYNVAVVQYSADSDNGTTGDLFQLFTELDGKTISEERSVVRRYTFADGLSEVRFPIYSDVRNASTYKNITALRFDPALTKEGVNICVERIFLIPDVPAAALFEEDDAVGFISRILPDANGYVTLPECTYTYYKKFIAWTDGTNTYLPGDKVKIDGFVTFHPKWEEGRIKDLDTEFYPGFTKKALVFSYDDAYVPGDRDLSEHLRKFGFVGTFNIIARAFDDYSEAELAEVRQIYAGHEVASHTNTHPMMHMTDSSTGEYLYTEEYCIDDIITGEEKLEKLFGTNIDGLAWPYTRPTTRKSVCKYVSEHYLYARGSGENGSFAVPDSFMDNWTFTLYQMHMPTNTGDHLTAYAEAYGAYETNKLSLFSVWGHSFEFYGESLNFSDYDRFLAACKNIDLWNPTCADYVRFVNAHRKLLIDSENVYNPSELPQYIQADGKEIVLAAGARYDGETVYENTARLNGDKIHITVNLDTRKADGKTAAVLAAAYDAAGKLLSCKISEIPADSLQTASLTLPSVPNAKTVKVFSFNNLSSFEPLENVRIIPVKTK